MMVLWKITGNDPTGWHTSSTTPVVVGTFVMVAAVWDGINATLCANGVEREQIIKNPSASGWGSESALGRFDTSGNGYFMNSEVHRFQYYVHAITLTKIPCSVGAVWASVELVLSLPTLATEALIV